MNAEQRFFSASDNRIKRAEESGEDVDEETAASGLINAAVRALAQVIDLYVPEGRNKSIALTSLEDVQMRSNRGIFADPSVR